MNKTISHIFDALGETKSTAVVIWMY